MDISIIEIDKEQLEDLKQISIKTFTETFADTNTEDDLSKYLDSSFNDEKLRSEIEEEGSTFYLAQIGSEVAGYLKINRDEAQTEIQDPKALEIERIYVAKKYQGEGVGRLLFQKGLDIAKANNLVFVWLGVWEHNQKAIDFYKKNGFVAFDKHIFKLGDDVQTDILMKLIL